ncbi:MAG: hypothetical protein IJC15_00945 [Clostridia bacterium]|nr:hypothetical protein [Clostridia bacterium]
MIKRTLLLSFVLLLAALLLLSACAGDTTPADPADTTNAETEPPVILDRLTDKYDADVNGITTVSGTFTDRITAEQLNEAIKMGQTTKADPMLYNIIQVMGLTKEDITLYSEMNGGSLDAALIDGLFLSGDAMREALRGDYTLMAGGYPYTVYELATMPEADFKALNIAPTDLSAFLSSIPTAAETIGEALDADVMYFIEANTEK